MVLGLIGTVPLAAAQSVDDVLGTTGSSQKDPDPQNVQDELDNLQKTGGGGLDGGGPKAPGNPTGAGGLDEIGGAVATAVAENWAVTSGITVALLGLTFLGWALASRYVDPKVALKNPQRSMLYGFIKGNPGVHLKQLSNEFRMKTSTVLWHIRKLEHADLVRSKKANGYRVFYPVSGGMEAKQLSTAVTALSNGNAKQIFEFVAINPGAHRRILSSRLTINPGTVRWHLKKLREAGLVAELAQDRFSTYYATDLGLKAMRQVAPFPLEITAPVINVAALPMTEPLVEDDEEAEPAIAS
ncbi:MAG: winged helix-turn-helix transcriptional regulator [Euryarchaeota archaeon]|nr:winged helix-turn-helix transcriptional regulator [Euryarchaeota archaeon]